MIYDLAGDRTVLFISHRLGFAKRADRIVVFNEGKIAEEGIHKELLKKRWIYSEMYKIKNLGIQHSIYALII